MNPNERLAEIEACLPNFKENIEDVTLWSKTSDQALKDFAFLISRVHHLTEVLERIEKKTNPMGLINNIAKKALEGKWE